jgi:2-polyprenyl-6-methoxyphenol hydroxylase-like FAD-dependent oxidoreductase
MESKKCWLTPGKRKEDILKALGVDGDWLLVHRVDLHNYLRKKAEEGFNGKKPVIHLASALKSAVSDLFEQSDWLKCTEVYQDPDTGKVVLEDGTELQADLIVGADGVHVSDHSPMNVMWQQITKSYTSPRP